MLIDTHAHLNFKEFKEDGHQIIKKCLDQDIWLINIGAQYSTSLRALEYAQKYQEGVYAAVGLHPIHVIKGSQEKNWQGQLEKMDFEKFDQEKYKKLLAHPKVVAMGEIGLDYTEETTDHQKEIQKETFFQQLELAQHLNKPVIIHCRKAYDDLIAILEMFNSGCAVCPMSCPGAGGGKLTGVGHCFMGRLAQAQKLLEMGFYLSFTGLITYARDYDKVIKEIPLDRILLETDCPYLTPEPYRGQRNDPTYLKQVADQIARIKEISFEEVARVTTQNAKKLFKI